MLHFTSKTDPEKGVFQQVYVEDGRQIDLCPELFYWKVGLDKGPGQLSYDKVWYYDNYLSAAFGVLRWFEDDGNGDITGWCKNLQTGENRNAGTSTRLRRD